MFYKSPHAQTTVIWHKPKRAVSYLLVHRAVSLKPAGSIMPLAAEFKNKLIPSPRFPERVVCSLLSIFSATLPFLSATAATLPTPSTAGLFAAWVSKLCCLTPQLGKSSFPGVKRWGAGWIGDRQRCICTQLANAESQPAVPSGRARQ